MQNEGTSMRGNPVKPASNSNATVLQAPASSQHDQIMAALDTLGIKLIKSEAEREMLKKLVEDARQHTQKLEKALESSRTDPTEAKKELDKSRREIDQSRTSQDRLDEKVKEAQAQMVRLARRIEADDQKRSRLQRRMERLETVAEEAQAALQSRAMVLLTDRSLAESSGMPYLPATGAMPPMAVNNNAPAMLAAPALENGAIGADAAPAQWWKRPLTLNGSTAIAAALLALGMGWLISQSLTQPPAIAVLRDGTLARVNLKTGVVEPLTFKTQPISNTATSAASLKTADAATDTQAAAAPADAGAQAPLTATASAALRPAELERLMPRDKNIPAALKDLQDKAYNGQAESQHDLAALYTAGQGVKQDYSRAAFWFGQAAQQGVANAAYNLGVLFHQGLGTKQDINRALDWYRLAALQGHPEAQYNLGIAYIEGIGTRYNPQLAAAFFQNAALGGIVEAAYNLGLILENGLLGEPQPQKAALWYRAATDRGSLEARNALGQLALRLGQDQSQAGLLSDGTSLATFMTSPQDAAPESADNTAAMAKLNAAAAGIGEGIPSRDQVLTAQVQEQLNRRNLYSGAQDGSMNGKTADAIKSYEKGNGLTVDGKPSPTLLAKMLKESTAQGEAQTASN